MSTRDEAVEAMAEAMDTAYSPDRYPIMTAMFRDYADTALDAALAVLHPTVPNSVEVLDALPVGTVLRGDAREEGVIVAHLTCLGWTEGEVPYDSTRLLFRHADLLGIPSWQVLWTPEDES